MKTGSVGRKRPVSDIRRDKVAVMIANYLLGS
jgi:hypothetical protein